MSELTITLRTGEYRGEMYEPGVGATMLELDVVKGLQLPSTAPLEFQHFSLRNSGDRIQQLTLPKDIARRIYNFSEATYVNGSGDFDCRTFLGYAMGWDTGIATGVDRAYAGDYTTPDATKNGLPYLVARQHGGPTPHALMGIERPGKSLSVAGVELPLVIADNATLLKAFGGFALLEVTEIENL